MGGEREKLCKYCSIANIWGKLDEGYMEIFSVILETFMYVSKLHESRLKIKTVKKASGTQESLQQRSADNELAKCPEENSV